ncbi:hypothetical protein [Palleronia abyssalis]|uniref:Uncharacterized protein n=1 Tax=Palleronia abyssalis TaxID=1501240 RepID=A0A2R8BZ80_9RHOB|nr:hypothetical protein [Palleronia abyssalis]SPJ25481.1 hypothetical protein PAA8504_03332 [Palleronia abyssalis]
MMPHWNDVEDLVRDILRAFESAKAAGEEDEAAITRAAALLAVHRDDLAAPDVSYGLAVIVLRSAAAVLAPGEPRH